MLKNQDKIHAEEAPAVEETPAPVVEEATAPVVEETAPVVEETAPVADEQLGIVSEPVVEEPAVVETAADDLTKIEGIGPKINELLQNAGIRTFSDLAAASPESIKAILDEAGPNFSVHDPATWPEQAKMAAEGRWEELKKWQDELDGGKVVVVPDDLTKIEGIGPKINELLQNARYPNFCSIGRLKCGCD